MGSARDRPCSSSLRWIFAQAPRAVARSRDALLGAFVADMKELIATRFPTTAFSVSEARPLGLGTRLTPGLLVALTISSLLVACGPDVVDVDTDGASASASTGAGSTGTMGPTWPKRVVLVTNHVADQSDSVELADGATIAGDADLSLYQSKVLSLRSPTPDSLCEKGKFATLGDVPTEVDTCPAALSGTWGQGAYLSATTTHTTEESMVIGLGLLLWNQEHTALYRVRVVGDSYDPQGGSTATFDYEPAP